MSHADDPIVYRICPRTVWIRARRIGEVMRSPEDARDGYVHLVRAHHLSKSLARHFAGQTDLVLLAVRVGRLPRAALRWVNSSDGERVPRLHGPLTFACVKEVYELPLDLCGTHALPSGVSRDSR